MFSVPAACVSYAKQAGRRSHMKEFALSSFFFMKKAPYSTYIPLGNILCSYSLRIRETSPFSWESFCTQCCLARTDVMVENQEYRSYDISVVMVRVTNRTDMRQLRGYTSQGATHANNGGKIQYLDY